MAMDTSAAEAFVYAKASGMLARSFVGNRAAQLFSARSLPELWTLVFKSEVPAVPETLLAKALENEAERQFLAQYKSLLKNYARPAPLLIALLHFYDYDNLKELGAALCLGEKEMPVVPDTAPFSLIDYQKWPDIAAMTRNSPLSWYDAVPAISDQQKNDYRLDCQYVDELWAAAHKCDVACRDAVVDLFRERFSMENVLWALRLRIYYQMSKEDVADHLAYSAPERSGRDPLVAEAMHTMGWDLDDYEHWHRWKFAALLNPHEDGVIWNVDPRWISNAYRRRYMQRAYRLFHQHPFTECPLACWFIIKQHELDNIRTASESLRLNMGGAQALQMSGILEVHNG